MTYMVGLIVRSAVDLDAMTRTAYASVLDLHPAAAWDAPRAMSPRIKAMVAGLPSAGLTATEAAAASSSLATVLAVYQERNRFVHDDLMPEADPQGEWWSMGGLHRTGGNDRPPRSRVTIEMLEHCERRLVRSTWRVWGLHKLIGVAASGGEIYERRRWMLMVNDEFDLHDRDNSISYSH